MSWKEHLQQVFECLNEANLKLKLSKCQFFKKHLHYLGHFTSEQSIQPLPGKISAIDKLKDPINIYEIHHCLVLAGYYRKLVPLFVDITKHLNKLFKKHAKFQWSLQYQDAFVYLRKVLCKEHIFQYPNMDNPYTLLPEANQYAYSGVLTQTIAIPDDLRTIAYTSGSFSNMQQRGTATEKETFAVYQSVLKFDLY